MSMKIEEEQKKVSDDRNIVHGTKITRDIMRSHVQHDHTRMEPRELLMNRTRLLKIILSVLFWSRR